VKFSRENSNFPIITGFSVVIFSSYYNYQAKSSELKVISISNELIAVLSFPDLGVNYCVKL